MLPGSVAGCPVTVLETWNVTWNQGNLLHCVGFGITPWGSTGPPQEGS